MKTILIAFLTALTFATVTRATDYHVALNGNDANPGASTVPFRTIQHAADVAQPGDVITVHEGVYRERISPPRGGESESKRIIYQAAPGEKVEIKGSEVVKNWVKDRNDTWKVRLPNSFFGSFNPYSDLIHGDWFNPKGRDHHTGAVYLNGEWLTEAAKREDVMEPLGSSALWFGDVGEKNTTIWAQFRGTNPNQQLVEINFQDNSEDVFVEVDHGPFLMDNNLFLSALSLRDLSQGGAYVHNLFTGAIKLHSYDSRQTPFLKSHSTKVAGYHDNPNGDDRYYNNLFVQGADLSVYDHAPLSMWMGGNVFLNGAKPSKDEKKPLVKPDFDPAIKLVQQADGLYIEMKYDPAWNTERTCKLLRSELLGRASISDASYEQSDGKPIRINTDYFARSRDESNPTPGPFENPGRGNVKLKVW